MEILTSTFFNYFVKKPSQFSRQYCSGRSISALVVCAKKSTIAKKSKKEIVSFTSTMEDIISTNMAGFVVVTEVKMGDQKMVVLSPQPRPLPDTLLLLSDVQYVDSS